MPNVMKCIRHCALEGSTGIFKTERELLIGKSPPWANKSRFVLINRSNIDLVITGETVHKRIHFTAGTLVNDLINEWCGKIIFRTGFVYITVIDTNPDCTLFFSYRDNVRNPICEWDRVNEASLKKLFNFRFNSCSLSGVHGV